MILRSQETNLTGQADTSCSLWSNILWPEGKVTKYTVHEAATMQGQGHQLLKKNRYLLQGNIEE